MPVPTLSPDDPFPMVRRELLAVRRAERQYDYSSPPGIACLKELHFTDKPGVDYLVAIARSNDRVSDHHVSLQVDAARKADRAKPLEVAVIAARSSVEAARNFWDATEKAAADTAKQPVTSLDTFGSLTDGLEAIPMVARLRKAPADRDLVFGWHELAGPNPFTLQQLRDRLPDHFPVDEGHFSRALATLLPRGPADSLARALAEGRLFLSDCAALAGVATTENAGRKKYTAAAMGLFVRPLDRSAAMLPVAIQCAQTPGAAAPIFTPADGWRWRIAQAFLSLGEGSLHEAREHLGRTHLVVEPFAIAANRNLASAHPVAVLLAPHFKVTHFINYTARNSLIADGGTLDQLMPQPIAITRDLTAEAVRTLDIGRADPRSRLASQGLLDADCVPDFPYRDDALPHWDSLRTWVGDYLRLYYRDDSVVAGDTELQNFVAELSARDGGRLLGVPAVQTVDALTGLLTFVIFTGSVQHAAVNFPQYPTMGFMPGIAAGLYAPPPTLATPDTEAAYIAALPPLDVTVLQMYTVFQLSAIRVTALADYPKFDDPRVAAPLSAMRARLASLESDIVAREAHRTLPYGYLRPSLVPASIII